MKVDVAQLKLLTEHRNIHIPLLDHMNFRHCPDAEGGPGNIVMQVDARHVNSLGNTHGGVLMTILDVVMAFNASQRDEQKRACVTIEMKTNFLSPGGMVGDLIEAVGCVRRHTRSIAFCEGEVRNAAGEVVATASGTFKYVNRQRTPAADV
ncbi:PaaI family thioesterase [Pseudomonas jinjuensis]|uniref:Uncharacterized domain 1-containing protein n=1 Tax=Pseudomonas jinjuensis TaxID=198616 RepID=A0A1H0A1G6_9PSED|nr:PaaI family thioesterase [Pseudomonas jinjuensis]SDN27408.1 uncharacterized domain 1-containing protein [Pseudomonas jinjuensis]